jgi:hypothetical protein
MKLTPLSHSLHIIIATDNCPSARGDKAHYLVESESTERVMRNLFPLTLPLIRLSQQELMFYEFQNKH